MPELNEVVCSPRTPTSVPTSDVAPDHKPSPSPSHSPTPSASATKAVIHEQHLCAFVQHLARWASHHDSSTHFHGKIGVLASDETIELGKSVRCVLSHYGHPEARKQVIIRLFPPRAPDTKYAMVIRCGSGWMSARDFFNKEYFVVLQAENKTKTLNELWSKEKLPRMRKPGAKVKPRPQTLVPEPESRNSVAVSPAFHQFVGLPQEIQDMVWVAASGLTGLFRPCRHRTSDYPVPHVRENFYPKPNSPTTVGKMLRVNKALYEHMAPWIYYTTTFHFELTGFTNFLWLSGPTNRANLRRVTFRFSSLALLHCIRWLSPAPVFLLFDPPAYTTPHGLQYFWRCQIQDLARDLHLHTLTLDLQGVKRDHIPMVVRVLRQAFGSVQYVKFQQDGKDVDGVFKGKKSWRAMCAEWFKGYNRHQGYMSDERRKKTMADLEKDMDEDREFFDRVEDAVGVRWP